MTLIEPAWKTFWKAHKKILVYGGLGLLLVGAALFLWQCGDEYVFKSKLQKQKDAIVTETKEIANISNQIANLQEQKAGKIAEVNAATEQLHKDVFGLEEAKKESNAALANFQTAVNVNTNIDRTLEDLNRTLEKLEN